jgi:PH (Pleckstrin Homology) domain-containing protein
MKVLRCRQWATGLGFMGAGIGLMIFNLGATPTDLFLPARVVYIGAGVGLGWFLVGRVALAGVQVQDAGLLVRNPFGHRLLHWHEIDSITLGRYVLFSKMGSVRLRDGSTVPLFGIQHTESVFNPGDRQAHDILERLNLALDASRS